jgi:hypothetical protein
MTQCVKKKAARTAANRERRERTGMMYGATMDSGTVPPRARASRLVAAWAVFGVAILLVQAVIKLGLVAVDPFLSGRGLSAFESTVCVAWVAFNLYAEGYRGFQKAFVPRTVARAFHLATEPRGLWVALAPAYAMALVHAKPRRLAISWLLVALIVLAVALVRRLPLPWRSVVDAGVVAGLMYGLVSLFATFARALRGEAPAVPLDLPGS